MRDYKTKKTPRKNEHNHRAGVMRGLSMWVFGFIVGFIAGVIVSQNSQLFILAKNLPPAQQPINIPAITDEADEPIQNLPPNYGFYDALEQGIPVSPVLYILQAASFGNQQNAIAYKQKILNLGYQAKVKRVKNKKDNLHQVWLGSYPLRKASQIQKMLKKKGIETTVVREDSVNK